MKFDTIPGYELSEHNQEEVKIWDETKRIINDYFSQR